MGLKKPTKSLERLWHQQGSAVSHTSSCPAPTQRLITLLRV